MVLNINIGKQLKNESAQTTELLVNTVWSYRQDFTGNKK